MWMVRQAGWNEGTVLVIGQSTCQLCNARYGKEFVELLDGGGLTVACGAGEMVGEIDGVGEVWGARRGSRSHIVGYTVGLIERCRK
jgi:hypothetical protein